MEIEHEIEHEVEDPTDPFDEANEIIEESGYEELELGSIKSQELETDYENEIYDLETDWFDQVLETKLNNVQSTNDPKELITRVGAVQYLPVVYGQRRVGSVCIHAVQVTNTPYLWLFYALADGDTPIAEIFNIYIDDEIIWSQGINNPYSKYKDNILIETTVGDHTSQPFIVAETDTTGEDNAWTNQHVLLGTVAVAIRIKWGSDIFSGVPQFVFEVIGNKVNGVAALPIESPILTYNPVNIIYDYLSNDVYGKGLPDTDINLNSFQIALPYFDESVVSYSGGPSHLRLQLGAVINTEHTVLENIRSLLLNSRCSLPYINGQFHLVIEKDYQPSDYGLAEYFNFNTDNILGSWNFSSGDISNRYNRVKVTYANFLTDFKSDMVIVESTNFRAQDQRLLEKSITLDFVTDTYRAVDAANIILRRSRQRLSASFVSTPEALKVTAGTIVTLTHPTPGWVNKVFKITKIILLKSGNCNVAVTEHEPTTYDLEVPEEYNISPDTILPDPTIVPDIANLSLTSDESVLTFANDGTLIVNIFVTWDVLTNIFINGYDVEFKKSLDSVWVTAGSPNSIGSNEVYIPNVLETVQYDVRVRARNTANFNGNWTQELNHSVIGKTSLPSDVNPVTITSVIKNNVYTLLWDPVSDLDSKEYEVRVGGTNWDTSVLVANIQSTELVLRDLPTGDNIYRVKAIDTGGRYSLNSADHTIIIVAPSDPIFNTSVIDGSVVKLSWTQVLGTYPIKSYLLRVYNPITALTTIISSALDATSYDYTINWAGTAIFYLTARDTADNVSAEVSTNVLVNNPSQPAITGSIDDINLVLMWPSAQTSLLIDHYHIKYRNDVLTDFDTAIELAQIKTTSFSFPLSSTIQRIYLVKAVDIAGNESDIGSLIYDPVAPSNLVLNPFQIVGSNIILSWNDPSTDLTIVEYVIREGTTWGTGVEITRTKALNHTLVGSWSGDKTFWVAAVDSAMNTMNIASGSIDNYGDPVSQVVTINIPDAVSSVDISFSEGSAVLIWSTPNSDLPVESYKITKGASKIVIAEVNSTTHSIIPNWSSIEEFYIQAKNTAGTLGSEFNFQINVVIPNAPTINAYTFADDRVEFTWEYDVSNPYLGSLPILNYDIRHDSGTGLWVDATKLLVTGTDGFSRRVDWLGNRRFWVTPIDSSGNLGGSAVTTVVILAPIAISIIPQVVDNNVLLTWTEAKNTLPISYYEVSRGDIYSSADIVGRISSQFAILFETVSGDFTYWITGVDTAGNFGVNNQITVRVSEPPDYVLYDTASDTGFTGTKVNAFVNSEDKLNIPVNTTETFAEHFTTNSWDQPQDQIDAGFPIYIQPTPISGSYSREWDLGVLLQNLSITFNITSLVVAGDLVFSTTASSKWEVVISTSEDNVIWTDYPTNSLKIFSPSFRYIKIVVTVTTDSGDDLLEISDISYVVDVKEKSDAGSGTVTVAANGATIVFNKDFVDINSITVTPSFDVAGGDTIDSVHAIYDFEDVPNPVDFIVYLYDEAGAPATGNFTWSARGH